MLDNKYFGNIKIRTTCCAIFPGTAQVICTVNINCQLSQLLILRFIFPIIKSHKFNSSSIFLISLSLGSAEAAGSEDVEQECSHQGSQDPHEAEDRRRQSCAEEEAAGPGERVGEGVSDVSGQTEQTGGGLQGNWTVQVLHCSGFYLSFFVCF